MLLDPAASFALARQLRSAEGVSLGEAFSFVSGLYFRGKLSYARAFGVAVGGSPGGFIITAGGGLCGLDEPVTSARLTGWANVSITEDNPHFTAPLVRQASLLLDVYPPHTRFVLLGSLATNKYVQPLLEVFAEQLWFPSELLGRGDMSRGSLLLRAARSGVELAYAPVANLRQR